MKTALTLTLLLLAFGYCYSRPAEPDQEQVEAPLAGVTCYGDSGCQGTQSTKQSSSLCCKSGKSYQNKGSTQCKSCGSSSAYHKQGEDDTGANNLHAPLAGVTCYGDSGCKGTQSTKQSYSLCCKSGKSYQNKGSTQCKSCGSSSAYHKQGEDDTGANNIYAPLAGVTCYGDSGCKGTQSTKQSSSLCCKSGKSYQNKGSTQCKSCGSFSAYHKQGEDDTGANNLHAPLAGVTCYGDSGCQGTQSTKQSSSLCCKSGKSYQNKGSTQCKSCGSSSAYHKQGEDDTGTNNLHAPLAGVTCYGDSNCQGTQFTKQSSSLCCKSGKSYQSKGSTECKNCGSSSAYHKQGEDDTGANNLHAPLAGVTCYGDSNCQGTQSTKQSSSLCCKSGKSYQNKGSTQCKSCGSSSAYHKQSEVDTGANNLHAPLDGVTCYSDCNCQGGQFTTQSTTLCCKSGKSFQKKGSKCTDNNNCKSCKRTEDETEKNGLHDPLLGVTCYSDKNCRGLVSSEQSSTACCNKKFGSYIKKGGSGRCINCPRKLTSQLQDHRRI